MSRIAPRSRFPYYSFHAATRTEQLWNLRPFNKLASTIILKMPFRIPTIMEFHWFSPSDSLYLAGFCLLALPSQLYFLLSMLCLLRNKTELLFTIDILPFAPKLPSEIQFSPDISRYHFFLPHGQFSS